jgi:hypothetical protein
VFNYRYSTLALLMNILPTEEVVSYQDLSFKVHVPTRRFGRFAAWGIGGHDAITELEERDPVEWAYEADRQNSGITIDVGATGLTHDVGVGTSGHLRTSLALAASRPAWELKRLDDQLDLQDQFAVDYTDVRLTAGSQLNYKLGARHLNQTGFFLHRLFYDYDLRLAPNAGAPLQPIAGGDGRSTLLQAYTQSSFDLSSRLTLNAGLHAQHFALTGHSTLEPRGSLRWQVRDGRAVSLGYGLHSQTEELRIYLAQQPAVGGVHTPNRDLDFTKAHHLVLGYEHRLSPASRLKLETYYQYLFDVPVIADSSYSMLNFEQDWEFSEPLVNEGAGRNYGVELTLERFLDAGYYYLLTGSLFNARYRGGDGVWRDTRWDRSYAASALFGKEFTLGSNMLGLNGRLEVIGGQRYSPYDAAASAAAQEVIFDERRAFEAREATSYVLDVTLLYRRNHRRFSEIWALQLKNALGHPASYLDFNYQTGTVEEVQDRVVLPVLSYRVEF